MTEDQPRPSAPLEEAAYSLTVKQAADRYAEAGFPRPTRRVQKYCARGDLECLKPDEVYFITPESVDRHIAHIAEIASASGRGPARSDAPERAPEKDAIIEARPDAPPDAPARLAVPEDRYVQQLETRLIEKDDEIRFLRSEVAMKNDQIKDHTERSRETNHLIAGLQKMLTPLLGGSRDHATHVETQTD